MSTGAILAVKVAHQDGRFSVQPGWISENIAAPLTPIVVNGVVFAASGPRTRRPHSTRCTARPGRRCGRAADDDAPLSGRSFWTGSGHVFVGTRDGTVYAFGFAMERR